MSKKFKKHVIVATIGARDLRYRPQNDGRFLLGAESDYTDVAHRLRCRPTLRAITQKLLEKLKSGEIDQDHFRIPILEPGLELIRQACPEIENTELKMVVTDQVPSNASDTIFSGELIAELVPYKSTSFIVIKDSPQAHDVVYREVREELTNVGDVDSIWILPTGGTPAMSEAIRLAGMNLYGERCSVVQVGRPSPPDKSGADKGSATRTKPDPYVQDTIRISTESLIKHRNYAAALDVLMRSDRHEFGWSPVLMHLLEHASARVNLDRGRAQSEAMKIKKAIKNPDEDLEKDLLVPLDDEDVLSFASELRHLIKTLILQQRWADALSRISLFGETCRATFVVGTAFAMSERSVDYRELMSLTYCYLDKETLSHDIPIADSILKLLKNMDFNQESDGWKIIEPSVKRKLYSRVECMVRERELKCWKSLPDRIGEFDRLIRLRNRSTHVPKGVSKMDFRDAWDGNECKAVKYIEGTVQVLYDCVGKVTTGKNDGTGKPFSGRDPYDKLKDRMLTYLKL